MSALSRRSFAESLAVAALAPLIGVRPEAIRFPEWTGTGSAEVLDEAGDFPGGTSIGGAANLVGVPGLFLKNGGGEDGLPTSLQLTGRALGEEPLLAIGIRYQERSSFHRLRPPGL